MLSSIIQDFLPTVAVLTDTVNHLYSLVVCSNRVAPVAYL